MRCGIDGCTGEVPRDGRVCSLGLHIHPGPNVRRALESQSELRKSATASAVLTKIKPGNVALLDAVLESVQNSRVGFSASTRTFLSLFETGGAYTNYYKIKSVEIVGSWKRDLAMKRRQVDAWLFDEYFEDVSMANIVTDETGSCSREGLVSYGDVTAYLNDAIYPARVSLFIEDSMLYYVAFCEKNNASVKPPPPETIGTWEDRGHLATLKVHGKINAGISESDAKDLIYRPHKTKKSDNVFIEAHVFGPIYNEAIYGLRLGAILHDALKRLEWETLNVILKDPPRNLINNFFTYGNEFVELHGPCSIHDAFARLRLEFRKNQGLLWLLRCLDGRYPENLRRSAAAESNRNLKHVAVNRFVRNRILSSVPGKDFDVQSSIDICHQEELSHSLSLIGQLVDPRHQETLSIVEHKLASGSALEVPQQELRDGLLEHNFYSALFRGVFDADWTAAFEVSLVVSKHEVVLSKVMFAILGEVKRVFVKSAGPVAQEATGTRFEGIEAHRTEESRAYSRWTKHRQLIAHARTSDAFDSKRKLSTGFIQIAKINSRLQWISDLLLSRRLIKADNSVRGFILDQIPYSTRNELCQSLTNLASCAVDLGFWDFAMDRIAEAFEADSDDPVVYNVEAELLSELGKLDEAARIFRDTMRRFPNNSVAVCGLAELLREKGAFEEAETLFRDAVARFPYSAHAANGLAELLKDTGRLDEAEDVFSAAMKTFPTDSVSVCGLAGLLRQRGKLDDAETLFRDAIARFEQNSYLRNGLALTFVLGDRFKHALEVLKDNIPPVTSAQWISRHIRGVVYQKMSNSEVAETIFRDGLRNVPFPKQRAFFLGSLTAIHLMSERLEDAQEAIDFMEDRQTIGVAKAAMTCLKAHLALLNEKQDIAQDYLRSPDLLKFQGLPTVRSVLKLFDEIVSEPSSNRKTKSANLADAELNLLIELAV